MTVGELIDILTKEDQGDIVLVNGYEYGLCDVDASNIRKIKFNRNVNSAYYAGPHKEDKDGQFFGVVIGRKADSSI